MNPPSSAPQPPPDALERILVVDLEATCWEGREPPEGQQREIIEIGVCVFDFAARQPLERESILVRPARSRVSDYCTQLTTLTQEALEAEGVPFAEACAALRERFDARNRLWASYGDWDRAKVRSQCTAFGVKYPFGPWHLNVKKMAAQALALGAGGGMHDVLKMLGIPLDGTHHRGHDDAWNIAAILERLLRDGTDIAPFLTHEPPTPVPE